MLEREGEYDYITVNLKHQEPIRLFLVPFDIYETGVHPSLFLHFECNSLPNITSKHYLSSSYL